MDFTAAAAISLSGMNVERARLDASALNLANMHTTRTPEGGPYKPLSVVSAYRPSVPFGGFLGSVGNVVPTAQVVAVQQQQVAPRLVLEPGHPDADAKGFVAYPAINSVAEMVNVMTAVRSYEANVVALNGAKAMAMKALDIGAGS